MYLIIYVGELQMITKYIITGMNILIRNIHLGCRRNIYVIE